MRAGSSALYERKRKSCNSYMTGCVYVLGRVMICEFGRIQLLASALNLCLHVPQLTVINLMWERDSEENN